MLAVERHLLRGGRAIWLLVPLFVLWSNLHSGFIIGLGFIALILIAEVSGGWLHWRDGAPSGRVRTLFYVLLACTAVSMINPNGPAILAYAFLTQGSGAQQTLILEWHSPDFHDWVVLPFGILLITLIALIAVNRRLRARDAALVAVTAALSMQSVRHIAIFVAATTPVWIDQTSMLLQKMRTRSAARRPQRPSLQFRVFTFSVLMGALVIVYASIRLLPAMRVVPNSLAYAREYPVCAARWLAQAPEPLKIFNQYGEGGYLADALSSRGGKVYIFGDAALMGDPLLYTYAG